MKVFFRGSVVTIALAFAVPAFASGIQFTCDPTITAISASLCSTLNTTIASQYATVFTNANATIYIESGSISGVGQSSQVYNGIAYSSYYNALNSTKSGANDVTAVNSLGGGTTNPVISGDLVATSAALASALGFSATGITSNSVTCLIGSAGCYDGIITISNAQNYYYDTGSYVAGQYDFFSVVEHETDEVLGTTSCLQNTTGTPSQCEFGGLTQTGAVSAADLFRYSANGTRSFLGTNGSQAEGSTAYFSINGGLTNIVAYNNTTNGADYGDFLTSCSHVQDAYGCNSSAGAGRNILNDGGVEIALLDAVGYNLTATGQSLSAASSPEPDSFWLLATGAGLVLLGVIRRQRTKK